MSDLIQKAKKAASVKNAMALVNTEDKNKALVTMAEFLLQEKAFLLSENEKDLIHGRASGLSDALIDRLTLTDARLQGMADGLRQVAALDDPIGETLETWDRPNGLKIKSIRVPLGVVGMVYEARPNVTVDAAALCLKTSNAVLLRGSSSALHSNMALVHVLKQALGQTALPVDAVQLLEDTSRETANQMFKLNEYLDVLIPRGGAGLIQTVVQNATIPVLETGVGNCHVYIDESAATEMAVSVAINAKVQRPSVCNAAETIIVHQKWAKEHLSSLFHALKDEGVIIHGDSKAVEADPDVILATEEDWTNEYLDKEVALKIVDTFEEALEHIQTYSTKHSEAIISETPEHVEQFFARIDAAALYHNASTRFTDGFEFGFGAEIGISTQKLHARGPMGLKALTSYKYLIEGNGQIKG